MTGIYFCTSERVFGDILFLIFILWLGFTFVHLRGYLGISGVSVRKWVSEIFCTQISRLVTYLTDQRNRQCNVGNGLSAKSSNMTMVTYHTCEAQRLQCSDQNKPSAIAETPIQYKGDRHATRREPTDGKERQKHARRELKSNEAREEQWGQQGIQLWSDNLRNIKSALLVKEIPWNLHPWLPISVK